MAKVSRTILLHHINSSKNQACASSEIVIVIGQIKYIVDGVFVHYE